MTTEKIAAIIIGIIIIGLLLVGFLPHTRTSNSALKCELAKQRMKDIEDAINTFAERTGRFPYSLDDLTVNIHPVDGEDYGPLLDKSSLYDPWGNHYVYTPDGEINPGGYDLICYGADDKP